MELLTHDLITERALFFMLGSLITGMLCFLSLKDKDSRLTVRSVSLIILSLLTIGMAIYMKDFPK